MRQPAFLLASSVLAAGCNGSETPSAYRYPRDQLIAALGGSVFGEQPCSRTINGYPGRLSDGDCYRMQPRRRYRGIWTDKFEGQHFYPNRTSPPGPDMRSGIWLEVEPGSLSAEQKKRMRARCAPSCNFHLDFIGRRTAVEGHYGHMGMSRHILVVDRIIKVMAVQDPEDG